MSGSAAVLPIPVFRRFLARMLAGIFGRRRTPEEQEAEDKRNAQAEFLIDQYGSSILRLAYSYLQNRSDAEEVLQDTLLAYLEKAPQFESLEHQKRWLLAVARNTALHRADYNKVRETSELNEELAAEHREDLSFVWDAVRQLPTEDREVIHLFYAEGMTSQEIASVLQEKETTIRSRLARARGKLKTVLQEAYDFDDKI